MPAGSEPRALPRTWRPFGVRLAGAALGGGLLVICLFAWIGLPADVRDEFTLFQRSTLVVLGLLAFSAWFALVRSRAVATTEGLTVVNGYRTRVFEWAELVAIHLPPGAPWAVLDLADGTTCPVMAIQGSDGARARQALVELRALMPT
jgi:hypothetical protein